MMAQDGALFTAGAVNVLLDAAREGRVEGLTEAVSTAERLGGTVFAERLGTPAERPMLVATSRTGVVYGLCGMRLPAHGGSTRDHHDASDRVRGAAQTAHP